MRPPNNESRPHTSRPRVATKRVRIIKRIRFTRGIWRFISLDRIGSRHVWDKQSGYYFVEWWEGRKRCRERAGVKHATLHKFRPTYATRLLEKGDDIVTVQQLLGHSDLDSARKYLSPDDSLQRAAVARLSLKG